METWIVRQDSKTAKAKTRAKKTDDRRPAWVFLGILAIVIKSVTASDPELIETIYSNNIFVLIRAISDHTIGRLEFPVLYLVIPFMLYRILKVYAKGVLHNGGCIMRLFNFLYSTVASLLWIIFWFTILWGLNYNRISTEDRLSLNIIEITNAELFEEVDSRVQELIPLRENLLQNEQAFSDQILPSDLEDIIRDDVLDVMSLLNYKPVGEVRIRNLNPKGILLHFGTAGFYFPFTGECNIDSGLHPLQKPFTMAHEMAHGYGVGNEGTCNFIAYLACRRSSDPFVQYSGELSFWRYLAGSYRSSNDEHYTAYREELHTGIVRDLNDINVNNELYPDVLPWLREAAYDSYLKTQGEADGIASYGKVVELAISFEKQYPGHPALQKK